MTGSTSPVRTLIDPLVGRRLPDVTMGKRKGWHRWTKHRQPGDYMKVLPAAEGGTAVWYVCDPYGQMGTLVTHTVTEHDDGTITVRPSILDDTDYTGQDLVDMRLRSIISDDRVKGWHGWLEAGTWRRA